MTLIWINVPEYKGVKVTLNDDITYTFKGSNGRVDQDYLKAYTHAAQIDDDPVIIDPSCIQYCKFNKQYRWDSAEDRIVKRGH